MAELDYMTDLPEEPREIHTYPTTIKEMGWGEYLAALAHRLEGHLPDVIGARAKKDIRNASKVFMAFSELGVVTAYLDSLDD